MDGGSADSVRRDHHPTGRKSLRTPRGVRFREVEQGAVHAQHMEAGPPLRPSTTAEVVQIEAHTNASVHNGKLGQQHHRGLLLRLRSARLAVSRPNGNPKGAPSMTPHKLSINGHRTRNLLPAVLIGDVWNSPVRQHGWLLEGLLRSRRQRVGLVLSGENEE